MEKTIIDRLIKISQKYPNKIAISFKEQNVTYKDLVKNTKNIATTLLKNEIFKKPVAIFIDRNINCIISMLSVIYAGGFYTVIDSEMPYERIKKITDVLKPYIVVTEKKLYEKANKFFDSKIIVFEEEINSEISETDLVKVQQKIISTDLMYTLFTSGSTGAPKGVAVSHRNVLEYSKWFIETFNITENTIFGSQTPFYFSMSVSDIFGSLSVGATFNIIPKVLFSFPIKLVEFLNQKKVNTIYWVPSAMSICANLKLFDYAKPMFLQKVLFAGESMPTKQLNYWIKNLPKCLYANLFGPTETTDICTYYIINRKFSDEEIIPIGHECNNADAFILGENGVITDTFEEGELYVRGDFVALGYYNNEEKTKEAFINNPINTAYPEKVYRTGDICKYNKYKELVFVSRKDSQIKRMGYRIELGEIESNAISIEDVKNAVCLYDNDKDHIILIYEGKISETDINIKLMQKIPSYMKPNKIFNIKTMPFNRNGKIDRVLLKKDYIKQEE